MRRNVVLSGLLALSFSALAVTSNAATITTLKNPTTWRVTINGIKYEPSNYSKCANLTDAKMWNNYYWCPVSVGTLSAEQVTKINSTSTTTTASTSTSTSSFSVTYLDNPTTWRVTLSGVKYEPSDYSKCANKTAAKLWNGYYWCPVSVGVLDAATVASLTNSTSTSGSTSSGTTTGSTSGTTSGTTSGGTVVTAPTTYTAKLAWTAPSTREDGSALPVSELKGYEIYYTSDDLTQSVTLPISSAGTTSYSVANLKAGTYHFAISAIDSKGLKSKLSTTVTSKFGS